jgi:flagellar biosynthetic protein FliR
VSDDARLLAALPGWAFAAILLFARAGSACMLLPGIGEAELSATIRLGFALALTVVLLPVLQPLMPAAPGDALRAASMIGAEIVTGLWLGWLARLWLLALPMAGQLAAGVLGLANVLQPDPMLGPQTSVLARALGLAAPVVLLAAGLHALPLSALAGSYAVIPPGIWLPAGDTAAVVARAAADSFALSLRLAAPFVLAAIVWQVALALTARLVPQLQIYFAALPGQLLGGLALLGLLGASVIATWQEAIGIVYAHLPGT